jgi:hypothetical protein
MGQSREAGSTCHTRRRKTREVTNTLYIIIVSKLTSEIANFRGGHVHRLHS